MKSECEKNVSDLNKVVVEKYHFLLHRQCLLGAVHAFSHFDRDDQYWGHLCTFVHRPRTMLLLTVINYDTPDFITLWSFFASSSY